MMVSDMLFALLIAISQRAKRRKVKNIYCCGYKSRSAVALLLVLLLLLLGHIAALAGCGLLLQME